MLAPNQEAAAQVAASAISAYKLVRGRKFKEAVAAYDDILRERPDSANLWVNRGVALQALGRLQDALDSFDAASRNRDGYCPAHINRAVVYNWQARYDLALREYDAALRLEPTNEAALLGRSTVHSAMGRFAESLADADQVLQRNPGSGSAHYNRALTLLSLGDYTEGFREHEWRFGTSSVLGKHRFPVQLWLGEDTRKTILVHCEQGLGDQIQFARYLWAMKERRLNVIVEAPAVMARLLEPIGFPVFVRNEPLPRFDLHCPIMSLAAVFGTTLSTVPTFPSYLSASEDAVARWKARFDRMPGKKIGLAWWSGVRPDQPIAVAMQRRKSIPTAEIARLLSEDAVFVSLQKDKPDDGTLNIFDPMPEVSDLSETAAIIENLDLVITVDSAVAHLAGALGKPVWVLNRADICWRWLSGDVKSPWYDSARIYRQSEPMKWGGVIDQVQSDLRDFIRA